MPPDNARLYHSPEGYRAMMAAYDAALANLTVPYQTRFVPTPYGETHTITAGPEGAPHLVFWHGLNGSSAMWFPYMETFARDFHVICIDTIGNAGKSAPARPDKNGPAYGEWASAALDGLRVDRAHMVGISNGGWLILKLAATAPHRIATATLISSAGFQRNRLRVAFQMLPAALSRSKERAARKFLEIMSPPGYQPSPEEIEAFRLIITHFRNEFAVPPLPDSDLRLLTAPAQLLMGQYEAAFNRDAVLERARRLLPNLVHSEVVPGVGHGMIGENPPLLESRIRQFLAEHA